MRFFILFTLTITSVMAQTLSVESGFEKKFDTYQNLKLLNTKGVRDSYNNLKNAKSNLAVLRSDILFLAKEGNVNFTFQDYSILSKLEAKSYLYFVAKEGVSVRRVTDLRGKKVSIGAVADMANFYLKKILSKVEGIELNVHFKAYDLDKSLEMLGKGKLDFLFLFADENFGQEVTKRGFVHLAMPQSFLKVLEENKGFNFLTKKITLENYLVVANSTNEAVVLPLIKQLNQKGVLLSKMEDSLGVLHPAIPKVLKQIKDEAIMNEVDKEKMEKVTKALKNINKETKSITKVIRDITKEASKIKREAGKFSKNSLKLTYERKAKQVLKKVEIEKKKIDLKRNGLEDLKEDKNVEALEMLVKELQAINITLSMYANDAEDVIGEIEIKLSEQEEEEAERAEKTEEASFVPAPLGNSIN